MTHINLGILGSTRGTVMLGLIQAIQTKKLNATIKIVLSNKPDALILTKARENHIAAEFVDPKSFSAEHYDRELSKILLQHQVQLVVLVGYLKILSPAFVAEWRNQMINVHPSLLPSFAGKTDLNVHQAVLESGVHESGCTVHYVTEEVDAGPILIQKKCPVLPTDTPDRLKFRVQTLEVDALCEAINLLGNPNEQ